MPTTNSSSTSNNKKAYREICVAEINTWKWGIKINHCIAKSSILNIAIASARTLPLSFSLSTSCCLTTSLYLVSYAKKANAFFLCWCCVVVCARSWPNISYIWLEPPPCDEVNAGRCVSRVARLVSVSVLPSLSLFCCLGQKVARQMPRTRTVAQAWPGSNRPGQKQLTTLNSHTTRTNKSNWSATQ